MDTGHYTMTLKGNEYRPSSRVEWLEVNELESYPYEHVSVQFVAFNFDVSL